MKKSIFNFVFPITFFFTSCGQTLPTKILQKNNSTLTSERDVVVGGPCDRCETMYEGIPPLEKISGELSLGNKNEPGEKMEIEGTVFMKDGKMPAKDIVLYIYHTNAKGLYTPADTQTTGRIHGNLRGWVKTNEKGKFKLHSIRPAPYPKSNIPAHIHFLIKEPGKTLYYIDEVWFRDDPFVTKSLKEKSEKRGGDMIISLEKKVGVWMGKLNITAGLNIPGYN